MAEAGFYLIKKQDFPGFIDALLKQFKIFAPVQANGEHNFAEIKTSKEIDLHGYLNTEFPPKKFFIREAEILMEYQKGGKISEKKAREKSVIFGVRPCDTHGLDVLDRVLLSWHTDVYYRKRRDNTLIFALNCSRADENCFCESMDTREATGFDLLFTDHGGEFHVEVGSEKGKAIIARSKLFRKTGQRVKRAKLEFRKKIRTENLEAAMTASFGNKFWEETAKHCLSCGSCTSVCPTCYCFDISHQGSMDRSSGKIVRMQNYCMLKPFTRVAGGACTRDSRTERVKQFFYHKLLYGKQTQDKFHCVGCGRCIKECMTHIDITEEAKKARDEYDYRKR